MVMCSGPGIGRLQSCTLLGGQQQLRYVLRLLVIYSGCSDTVVVFSEEKVSQQRRRHKVRVIF